MSSQRFENLAFRQKKYFNSTYGLSVYAVPQVIKYPVIKKWRRCLGVEEVKGKKYAHLIFPQSESSSAASQRKQMSVRVAGRERCNAV
jgi:hypothetical protein